MRRCLSLALLMFAGISPAVAATCTFSIANLSFGTYLGTLQTGVTPAAINCPNGTQYTIPLNAGIGAGATETIRKMTGPAGATLNYQLFQDAARSINWGNTTQTDVAGTGTGKLQTVYIYAQVTAGQIVAPGTYTDTMSSATTTFTVTAVVQPACQITATNLAFGVYANTQTDATSTISVTCTRSTPYNVGLDNGGYGRMMNTNKADRLPYILAQDSARAVNWGTNVGTDTKAGTGSGALQTLTVYGRILAAQNKNPGSYADTVTVTISY